VRMPPTQPLAHTPPCTHTHRPPYTDHHSLHAPNRHSNRHSKPTPQTHAQVDDELAELFLAEETITPEILKAAVRRATLDNKFQVGRVLCRFDA